MLLALSHSLPYLTLQHFLGGEYFHPDFPDGGTEAQSSYEVAEPVSAGQIHTLGHPDIPASVYLTKYLPIFLTHLYLLNSPLCQMLCWDWVYYQNNLNQPQVIKHPSFLKM